MFRYLLRLSAEEPDDPDAIPNWRVGEMFVLGDGEQRRIWEIDAAVAVLRCE